MKPAPVLAALVLGLALSAPLQAHRTEGLLQSSLVEVLPGQVGVEVTLVPGMDIASKVVALLDADGDGVFSEAESAAWAARFLAGQRVTVDGRVLPLELAGIRASPLAEMTGGHAEIVVRFTAGLGRLARGPRTIVCANRYEPFTGAYQVNGLVPRAPGVRIGGHRCDDRQQELTLAVEFSGTENPATQTATSGPTFPPNHPDTAIRWLIGLNLAGATAMTLVRFRRRPIRAER